MLCDACSLYAISQCGRDHDPAMIRARSFAWDRTPCYATMHRVFKMMDHVTFKRVLPTWVQAQGGDLEQPLVVDGK